ncbi:MAG: SRPBCC family protein [Deltaproteobacteria bacterium]|nr:SRPBCC family protein [Deltaproteobacteria bacterium]MBW2390394.1 SRPBCC family protein [Deltaproteobacteria bacterium]MBW2724635.1 SRPBCC family protein [Deltaproteobacteria bacterium]
MIEVLVSRDCDLSAEVAYELLADFGNTSWMKGVAKTEVDGDGVGMVRSIYVSPDAPPVREMMTERDDLARKVAYTITEGNPLPVDDYSAFVQVTEVGSGCRIEWAGSFEAKGTDEATAKTTVEGMYGVLIDWLLEGAGQA